MTMEGDDERSFEDSLAEAAAAIRESVGARIRVTLALVDLGLARFSMRLEDVQVEPGRLFLSGDFTLDATAGELYKEAGIPVNEEGWIHTSTFGGEVRVETSEGFFMEVAPL